MDGVGYFLGLAQQVFFLVVGFWPLTMLLIVAWMGTLVATRPAPNGSWRWTFGIGCLLPLAFPVAILLCGVVFVHDPPPDVEVEAPAYPVYLIEGLLLSLLPLTAALVWWRPAHWPTVVASALLAGYLSWCALVISSMSVTGVWL
jgi:hypothetical protein